MHDTEESQTTASDDIVARIAAGGFCFVSSATMREALQRFGTPTDWVAFAASWNDLALDTYLADYGRYRRRRHAVFSVLRDGAALRMPHQAHYQSRAYNALQGGIERWFEPIDVAITDGATVRSLLQFCAVHFGALAPEALQWRVEMHQFRIEARAGEPGQPTPEGAHRDGVDYVLVLLVDRVNIRSGTTTIQSVADGALLGSFTLTHALDAALVDDARVFHGVTPVEPLDTQQPAHRDVFVITFKRDPSLSTKN